jgi:hypothetical protein
LRKYLHLYKLLEEINKLGFSQSDYNHILFHTNLKVTRTNKMGLIYFWITGFIVLLKLNPSEDANSSRGIEIGNGDIAQIEILVSFMKKITTYMGQQF